MIRSDKMKNKITITAALLAVMISMTGVASAFDLVIVGGGNPIILQPGQSITNLGLNGTNILSDDNGASFALASGVSSCTTGGCSTADVTVATVATFGPVTYPTYSQANAVTSISMSASPTSKNNTNFVIFVQAGPSGGNSGESGLATRTVKLFIPPANISGMKFNDLNNNGARDPGEPGLANWLITLKNGTNAVVGTMNTLGDGSYIFSNLPADTYTVSETLKPSWAQTYPPSGTWTVVLAGVDQTGKDFGNHIPLANISGMKFNDTNGNGIKDPGEPGLANWVITLKNDTNAVVGTMNTLGDGSYIFSNLPPDTYTVSETLQAGWTQTYPTPVPPGTWTVVLAGVDQTGKDFGNTQQVLKQGKVTGWGLLGPKTAPEKKFQIFAFYPTSGSGAQGTVEVTDYKNSLTIKSINITSVTTSLGSPRTGTITGYATVNGAGSYSFTVNVVDAANPGAGQDTFSISLPGYPYLNSGTLSMGDIQVVK
jgi:hypothetical protein